METINDEIIPIKKMSDPPEQISAEEMEWRIKEIIKCKKDIVYFAENYFRIISLDGGLKLIKLYEKQKELLRAFADNRRTIALASRQTGKTTTYTIFALWLTTFYPDKRIMICANQLATAIEVMNRIRLAYEYLPYFIKAPVDIYNRGEITFCNKSSVRAFSTSSSSARGFSANVLVLDELAFVPRGIVDDFFSSVMPIVSSSKDSKVIIVSTPNGASGMYYDLWQSAIGKSENDEGWKPVRIDWFEVPGRDEKWKQQQIASFGMDKWRQEFACEFLVGSSVHKLIPDEEIEKYRIQIKEWQSQNVNQGKYMVITSETEQKAYEFIMWHEFRKDRTYVASGDVAEGTGGDNSVLYIWDITRTDNITMCAKFCSNKTNSVEFAFVCNKILKLYGNPFFICEANGVGAPFIDVLRITHEYQNIVREGKDHGFGVRSHIQSKIKACLWLNQTFTTRGIGWEIYDMDLVDEMSTFVKKEGRAHVIYQAAQGAHDDLMMALCWCAYMIQPTIAERYFDVVETFMSDAQQELPKFIRPAYDYEEADLKYIEEHPLYQKFVEDEKRRKFIITDKKEPQVQEPPRQRFSVPPDFRYGNDLPTELRRNIPSDYTPITDSPNKRSSTPFFIGNSGSEWGEWTDADFEGPSWN